MSYLHSVYLHGINVHIYIACVTDIYIACVTDIYNGVLLIFTLRVLLIFTMRVLQIRTRNDQRIDITPPTMQITMTTVVEQIVPT